MVKLNYLTLRDLSQFPKKVEYPFNIFFVKKKKVNLNYCLLFQRMICIVLGVAFKIHFIKLSRNLDGSGYKFSKTLLKCQTLNTFKSL